MLASVCLWGCGGKQPESQNDSSEEPGEFVDYVADLKLVRGGSSRQAEVTVHGFIDGDTTHFNIDDPTFPEKVLKARYIAINTPESTGKIEEYGKQASNFTREHLASAKSIILESDDENWNKDSTGSRYMVWVWYLPEGGTEYRNLNLEILQNGLAIASSTANNRYGTVCSAALKQARDQKIGMYSGQPDPLFYYGDAVELTLAELRAHIGEYNGVKVAFEGVVTRGYDNSVYVEEYDPDTERYYGMAIYIGFNLSGQGQAIMRVGNRVRVVGTVQYWEGGGTYQVSGLSYRAVKPDDPSNIQKLGEGFEPAYVPITGEQFADDAYMAGAMNTTVSMQNLRVVSIYTTSDPSSDDCGAMTLTCETESGLRIKVRTSPLKDANGVLVTESAYKGKNINVRGLIDLYEDAYQIKLFSVNDITINE